MAGRMGQEGIAIIRRRRALAEHPFGTNKCRSAYRHFPVRGFARGIELDGTGLQSDGDDQHLRPRHLARPLVVTALERVASFPRII